MAEYDPRTPMEFQEVDFYLTDNLDFTKRTWGIIIGGRNFEEAFKLHFTRICFLNQGEVRERAIFYKQINQIPYGEKQLLKVVPESVVRLALANLATILKRQSIDWKGNVKPEIVKDSEQRTTKEAITKEATS